jgi:hypothetical protein
MAETLGSLCDKLTIVKLKQWHSDEPARLASLAEQENQLKNEIDEFSADAICGKIPLEKLTFAANKVYRKEGNAIKGVEGNMGDVISQLAEVNCKLWHEQEKVYEFDKVPVEQKDGVVKQLALLNLERNQCIDKIDKSLRAYVESLRYKK